MASSNTCLDKSPLFVSFLNSLPLFVVLTHPRSYKITNSEYRDLSWKLIVQLQDMPKSYKSFVMKWRCAGFSNNDRTPNNSKNTDKPKHKSNFIKEAFKVLGKLKEKHAKKCSKKPKTPSSSNGQKDKDDRDQDWTPKLFRSRSARRISPMPCSKSPKTLRRLSTFPSPPSYESSSFVEPSSRESSNPSTPISRRKTHSQPIIFSHSGCLRTPQPIEKSLECTLEELCFGCDKNITVTRDIVSRNGSIVQEEEKLVIKVKPGWRKGTKVVMEGKGSETPGFLRSDIIFSIDEKEHPMFEREGEDDLELGVEIPLVQALTGCKISVPLLGGGEMKLQLDEIIHPGYEKIIPGQGMPKPKEEGIRGDLRLKFLVEFPHDLRDEQRSELVSILRGIFS